MMETGDMKIEWRKASSLREYARNARKITERAVDYIAKSIRDFGFINPVVVTADGELVCGHASVRAAKKAGIEEVPCVVADDLTPDQVRAFRLADNKTAAMAIWNTEELAAEAKKLVGSEFTMDDLGFDPAMLGSMAEDLRTDDNNSVDNSNADTSGEGADIANTSEELDLDGDFGDAAFEHVCPHCGLKF